MNDKYLKVFKYNFCLSLSKVVPVYQKVYYREINKVLNENFSNPQILNLTDGPTFQLSTPDKLFFAKLFYKKNIKLLDEIKKVFPDKQYFKIKSHIYLLVEPFQPFEILNTDGDYQVDELVNDLLKIHQVKLPKRDLYNVLKKETIARVKKLPITGLKEIISYVKNYDYPKADSLIHEDIQPKNIFIDGDAVRLFDYENARIGHPYDDFSYLYLFSEQYPKLVDKIVMTYFSSHVPADFKDLMNHFVVLRYLTNLAGSYQFNNQETLNRNAYTIINRYIKND